MMNITAVYAKTADPPALCAFGCGDIGHTRPQPLLGTPADLNRRRTDLLDWGILGFELGHAG